MTRVDGIATKHQYRGSSEQAIAACLDEVLAACVPSTVARRYLPAGEPDETQAELAALVAAAAKGTQLQDA